jgi:hypothetical protein
VSPKAVARLYALGRAGIGAGVLVAPAALGRPWIGAAADKPGAQIAMRALGVRDVILGGISLHVLDRGPVAARAAQACAVADLVDGAATLASARSLPATAYGVVALAFAGAATGFALSRALSG